MNIAISNYLVGGGNTGLEPIISNNTVTGIKLLDCVIPEGIITIGDYAFYKCYALGTINISKDTPYFPRLIFNPKIFLNFEDNYTKLTNINIPNGWKPTKQLNNSWNIMLAFSALPFPKVAECANNLGSWDNGTGNCTIYLSQSNKEQLSSVESTLRGKGYTVEYI